MRKLIREMILKEVGLGVGMESTAQMIWEWANWLLKERDSGRTCCWRTEAKENDCNSACFESNPDWFDFV